MTNKHADLLHHRATRIMLLVLFLFLAAFTDMVTLAICFTEIVKIPAWLKWMNLLWVIMSGVLVILAATLWTKERFAKVENERTFLNTFTKDETRFRRLTVIIALVLPFNCLWFYKALGNPVLNVESCRIYQPADNGTLMVSAPGELWPPQTWVPAGIANDDIPAQPDCESAINTWFDDRFHGLSGDRWEEAYDFSLRLFGFIAGAVADSQLGTLSGGFMEDLTDIYDLYMMSFENVGLLKEGKKSIKAGEFFYVFDFDQVVCGVIILSYVFLFLRLGIGNEKVTVFSTKCEYGQGFTLAASLTQEILFLFIRIYAWWRYEIPVSVLILKNLVSIWGEVQDLINLSKKTATGAESSEDEDEMALLSGGEDSGEETEETEPLSRCIGKYECHTYDGTEDKNPWHYVTVTRRNSSTLEWTNRAEVNWALKLSKDDPDRLDTLKDCVYFAEKGGQGKFVEVREDQDGGVKALIFQGEAYDRCDAFSE